VLVSGLCFAEEKIAGHDSTSDVSVRQSNMHCYDLDAVSDGALLADRAGCRCCHLFVQCNRYFGIAEQDVTPSHAADRRADANC